MSQSVDVSQIRIDVTFPEAGTTVHLRAPKDCPRRIVVMAIWEAVTECARLAESLVDAEGPK